MSVLKLAIAAMLLLGSNAALAQTVTAYQSGLRVAEGRGYANAGCYAQVFAKHAVVVEKANGRRNWYAASTPAYNAEQRSRCGVDRLADRAARRQTQEAGAYLVPRSRGAYSAGLRVAVQRGHSGEKAACFARTYATFASTRPSANGRVARAISGRHETAYTAELFSQCGISR